MTLLCQFLDHTQRMYLLWRGSRPPIRFHFLLPHSSSGSLNILSKIFRLLPDSSAHTLYTRS